MHAKNSRRLEKVNPLYLHSYDEDLGIMGVGHFNRNNAGSLPHTDCADSGGIPTT